MEWPYDHPRRGDMPYTSHALRVNEYTIRQPPYAPRTRPGRRCTPTSRAGAAPTTRRTSSSTRRSIPTPGTSYAWVRARVPRRQDEHLGPARPAPLRLRLQGQEPRRLRRGLADLLRRHRALLRQGRPLPRHLRPSGGAAHLPDSMFQRPTRLNAAEVQAAPVDGEVAGACSRRIAPASPPTASSTTSTAAAASAAAPAAAARAAATSTPPSTPPPASSTRPWTPAASIVRTGSHRARGDGRSRPRARRAAWPSSTRPRGETLRGAGTVVVIGASTLESARLLLLSKSRAAPERHRQLAAATSATTSAST